MTKITLTDIQKQAAAALKEGHILVAYKDGGAVRMETERGRDPYVWRGGSWRRMHAA